MRARERGGVKKPVPMGAKLALGFVAGIATALLTIVMDVILAIAIGGLGVGIAVALYLRIRSDSTSFHRQ
jgi:hypothetical protein